MSLRALALRTASRAEQEIRAYPRLHAAFYGAIARNDRVRLLAGRVKNSVRGVGDARGRAVARVDHPDVTAARTTAVSHRLGLSDPGGSPS